MGQRFCEIMIIKKIHHFHIFLTEGAGVGKSHLIKTMFLSVSKLLLYKGGDPEKPNFYLLLPQELLL